VSRILTKVATKWQEKFMGFHKKQRQSARAFFSINAGVATATSLP
jgi:hypothetical protein